MLAPPRTAMMRTMSPDEAAGRFQQLRPRLIHVAYRMLGSISDAEDVVQEAFLRWNEADHAAIREPEAWLRRVVARLCLDQLKSARHRREVYPGPWLPDPVLDAPQDDLDDITLPLMLALERLSPLERAAFLLHDVFGASFDEIAETIGRESATCRQLASRARTHVRAERPRFRMPRERGLKFAEAFFEASRHGDMNRLRQMLAADVVAWADGGGKIPTRPEPIVGIEDVMNLHAALARLFARQMSRLVRYGFVNGLPGFVSIEQDNVLQTTALEIENDRIFAIYVMRNPDKLQHLRGHVIQ
jgi:RNA polymerase sigma-70 factor, ECF subfamily